MRRRLLRQLLLAGLCLPAPLRAARPAAGMPVVVALTAEFGLRHSTSAQAIEQGLRLASAEINARGGVLGGRPLQLMARDDRSIPARAIRNLEEFLQVPDLVAVVGGKFSPVLIELEPLARRAGLPLLAPWSAADQITGPGSGGSVVFRLGLRDSWAMETMVGHLAHRGGGRSIGLMVPNTAWGHSNVEALRRLCAATGLGHRVEWYSWGERSLLPQYRVLLAGGMDGLVLVANEGEAALLLREMAGLPAARRVPVAAHAGVTGGDLFAMAGAALGDVDLGIVQTFTFADRQSPLRRRILHALQAQGGPVPVERVSTLGFAHAYDLLHLLARAVDLAGSTQRSRVRDALEALPPHVGLVKRYVRPFAHDRHDALCAEDLFMTRFAKDGRLVRFEEGR